MKHILEVFHDCNVFSLSSASIVKEIPKKDKEILKQTCLESEKELLKDRYFYYCKDGSDEEFEKIFKDIVDECSVFYKKVIEGKIEKGKSPFICDYLGKGTKYSEPMQIYWHFYHNIEHCFISLDDLTSLEEIDSFRSQELEDDKNKALKNNFINHEYTYKTHCTCGPLQLVYYFNLNEQTKQWLSQFKTDYDLENTCFEDLAIYKNKELKFSSCTHENFNSLE